MEPGRYRITDQPYSNDDDEARRHFNKTTLFENGRYTVQWPWKSHTAKCKLPDNFALAVGRMKSLSKRLSLDNNLLNNYDAVIKLQLERGIIEVAPKETTHHIHYLPHHPVVTPHKSTKVRVVYDASARTRKGVPCLNDCLYFSEYYQQVSRLKNRHAGL